MFENFKKIKIKGGFFDTDTEFQVFYEAPIGLVYGRNGSGKTTIAKCFRELAKNSGEEPSTEYFASTTPAFADDNKEQIFVFDEDFVREKVRVDNSDEIAAIVMLGEQGEIDDQIKAKENELKLVSERLAVLEGLKEEYASQNNVKSHLYHFGLIKGLLQSDGGWADIDRDVKGNTTKSSVTLKTVDAFLAMPEPEESETELKTQLEKDYEVYMNSDSGTRVEWVDYKMACPDNLDDVEGLLKEAVEKPELNDRERRLLAFLTEHVQGDTRKLVEEKWDFCPTCLREVDDADRSNMAATLTKLLNEKAKAYKARSAVMMARFAPVEATMPVFPNNLHQNERNDAKASLADLNKQLLKVKTLLEERNNRLYDAMEHPFDEEFANDYAKAVADFKSDMAALKQLVVDYDKTVADLGKVQKRLLDENKKLARKRLASHLTIYQKAKADGEKNLADWEAKNQERQALVDAIAELRTKKKNTEIALDYINQQLQYVFFSNRKVKLVPGTDGNYKLKVNGKVVRPNKISVGERNVLGLCYFFATLFSGKEKAKKYKEESLIVIDDPVSSFDHGNRVGVMSLLRFQFCNILKGNANSRILVMSHDLQSIFDLVKIRKELCEDISGKVREECHRYLELENKVMDRRESGNEYRKLLVHVFEYAKKGATAHDDPDDLLETSIGNIMRRLLEAYSSFFYNESFEKMVRKDDVLNAIDPTKRTYYENFMYRLALNAESHSAEQVYTLTDMTPFFTKSEKLQTAKSLMLFMYYVNKPHLEAYFGKNAADNLATILSWQTEEATWIANAS